MGGQQQHKQLAIPSKGLGAKAGAMRSPGRQLQLGGGALGGHSYTAMGEQHNDSGFHNPWSASKTKRVQAVCEAVLCVCSAVQWMVSDAVLCHAVEMLVEGAPYLCNDVKCTRQCFGRAAEVSGLELLDDGADSSWVLAHVAGRNHTHRWVLGWA